MSEKQRLLEDLHAGADVLREIIDAHQTPVPGGQPRVYVDPEKLGKIADTLHRASDHITEEDD